MDGHTVNQLDTSTVPVIADKEVRPAAKDQATLISLLNLGTTSENQKQATVGSICLGEGVPPVPARLVEKIRRGDFVEIYELLSDLWLRAEDKETGTHSGRHRQVMDVKVWAQCFVSYV